MTDYSTILQWDDDQIMTEAKKIMYLYGLKDTIRYGIERKEDLITQSVAEHISLMQFLAKYFLQLENVGTTLDVIKVYDMILIHDMGEIETGDYPTFKKDQKIIRQEQEAYAVVASKSPYLLSKDIHNLLREYDEQNTDESKFVKAIDKLEPFFYMYGDKAHKMITQGTKLTKEQFEYCKAQETVKIKPYPVMYKFFTTLMQYQIDNKFYIDE